MKVGVTGQGQGTLHREMTCEQVSKAKSTEHPSLPMRV